jgi:hypothetical protein
MPRLQGLRPVRGQVHHVGDVLLLCVVHAGGPETDQSAMMGEGSIPGQSVEFPVRVDPETDGPTAQLCALVWATNAVASPDWRSFRTHYLTPSLTRS